MKLIIPISYFTGKPRSEFWILDIDSLSTKLLSCLPNSNHPVRGKGITGITQMNSSYYVACDFNRVFLIDVHGGISAMLALPEFNDLHAVSLVNEGILVANTGRDAIVLLDNDFQWMRQWDGLSTEQWQQRIQGQYVVDSHYYDTPDMSIPFCQRRLPDLRHLNYALQLPDGRYIASSFEAKGYIDVDNWEMISNKLPYEPHDGCLHKGRLWVTTVAGGIYSSALTEFLEFKLEIELFDHVPHHGWCRGLCLIGDKLFIGVTAIQEKNPRVNWLKQPLNQTRSGIYQLCAISLKVEQFYDFSDSDGARIFSMIEALPC